MTPKEKRDRLFKKSRPHIRPFEQKDMAWLWVAYKAGSFKFPEELSQEEFSQQMAVALDGVTNYLVEDGNAKFKAGRGPVALVGVASDGAKIEPAVAIFKWATTKNVLRGFVGFFQWVKHQQNVECEVTVSAKDKLMQRVCNYGVLYPREMKTTYGVKGRKQ